MLAQDQPISLSESEQEIEPRVPFGHIEPPTSRYLNRQWDSYTSVPPTPGAENLIINQAQLRQPNHIQRPTSIKHKEPSHCCCITIQIIKWVDIAIAQYETFPVH